jgi:Ca-activated chloride channel family protein
MWTTCAIVAACAVAAESMAIGAEPSNPDGKPQQIAIVATVTDRDHRVVSGLTPADFEVRENGHPRPLIGFDPSRRPLSVTVMVDRSDSLWLGPRGVRAAAARFLTDLLPSDEARVCGFTGDIVCSPRFTSDHDTLAQEVGHLKTGFGTRLYDAVSATLDAMQLTPQGRRRLIVIFSDGEDNGSRLMFHDVIERARERDVMVYGIGLQTRIDDGDDIVPSRPDRTVMPLTAETGGGYYEPAQSHDLVSIVARIEEELRHQYVLTFAPQSNAGRTHRIQVRTTEPDLRVRARERLSTPNK